MKHSWKNRLRWVSASLTHQDAEAEFLNLLSTKNLPGSWQQQDERVWRTGKSNNAPWAQRAKESGSLTVWRSFKENDNEKWLWVQSAQFVSKADATEALRAAPEKFLRNRKSQVEVVSEQEVKPPLLPGQEAAWSLIQQTDGPRGAGVTHYFAFVVSSFLVVMGASANGSLWEPDDLRSINQTQIDLLL